MNAEDVFSSAEIAKLKNTKVCPFPFTRIELGHIHKEFVPCCYAWFKPNYQTEFKKDEKSYDYEQTWNSRQARALRASIYDGSYKYCNTERCNKPQMSLYEMIKMDPNYFETPLNRSTMKDILNQNDRLESGPTSVSLSGDYKCNLKCPTCREDYKTSSSDYEKFLIHAEMHFLEKSKKNLEVLKLSNNGEVFFSKDQRAIIKSFSPRDYPSLKHVFVITNALLFNQKTYDALLPGSKYIKKIAVSLDAGNEDTYAITRGGNWKQLLKNLKWIGETRREGKFLWVNYNFVVRKANYKSIPEFIKLGRENNVDRFEFTQYDDWRALYGTELSLSDTYESEAIHEKTHPEHKNLIEVFRPFVQDEDIEININNLDFSL